MPGVGLSEAGRAQTAHLAERLVDDGLAAVYSSPLQRARETAEPIAGRLGLPVRIDDGLNEMDFGDWTGKTFDTLAGDPVWRSFNTFRSGTRVPNGETMGEAQLRMTLALEQLCARHAAGERVAIVGHGDLIKATIAYYLGVPLDLFQRLEISPASLSIVELNDWGPRVLCVNN